MAGRLQSGLVPEIEGLMEARGLASITVIAFDRDGEIWSGSFGYANIAQGVEASRETVYNTGSTFKIFVVTAIMQLVDSGALELDAPVNTYLSAPLKTFEPGPPLTLRHMLSHRAGLAASRPVPDWDIWSRKAPPSIEEQLAAITAVEPPGLRYDYCNSCFPLYANIIETVSGESLERYIRDHILLPVGSKYTEPLYPDAQMVQFMALPYEQVGRTPIPMPQKFLESWMSGDTYLRPADMAAFLGIFLNGGKAGDHSILSADTVAAMELPQYDGDISLGFVSEIQDGRRVLWWDGGVYGGSTVYHLEPEAGIGIYIASNSNQTTDELHALARRARDILRGQTQTKPIEFQQAENIAPVWLERPELERYTGTYEIEGTPAPIHVDILNNHLALTNPAGRRFNLILTSPDSGILIGPREKIRFDLGGSGTPGRLTIGGDEGTTAIRTQVPER